MRGKNKSMKRIFLKIFAALILIGLIVAISVIKSSVSAKREAERIASIKEEYFKTQDSLLLARMDDSTRFYIDSIIRMETFYQAQIDSLNQFYAEKDSLRAIEEARRKNAADSKTSSSKQAAKMTPGQKTEIDETSKEVRSDFDSLFKMLPDDLTQYEKEVSRREIVVDLSNKYKISPARVKKILGKSLNRL